MAVSSNRSALAIVAAPDGQRNDHITFRRDYPSKTVLSGGQLADTLKNRRCTIKYIEVFFRNRVNVPGKSGIERSGSTGCVS
jgi:hypothetical protein